eukprot:CAMPEP_0178929746 /NCGR_PEP_ID=MMETSP0786-20121207/20805_1 /TAXON_ID=186022 /ORGANISM="Thalassionema frauenfeldii, Strain CCMP 1798" /LENGTH=154 /DNA_ID=CAMNT_0020606105 /DNA_START=73 /DNA_END=534 /DNA_ORIENTATION=+
MTWPQRLLKCCWGLPPMMLVVYIYLFVELPALISDTNSILNIDELFDINLDELLPWLSPSKKLPKTRYRKISIDLGNGNCEWTQAEALGEDSEPYGTLFASYPASGMRIAWQQTEGITGIAVGDDFHLGGTSAYDKVGLIKTQYPHLEGIWTYR